MMGVYSEIINSCSDLGHDYIGYLQTKDLEGIFDQYWISPDGCLFKICWPPLRRNGLMGFEPWPTGERPHGKVLPFRFTGTVNCNGGFSVGYSSKAFYFVDGRLKS